VFDQDFKDFEIIITDDSPNDSVEELVKKYSSDSRIKYFKNKTTLGSPENWNESIRKANGKYVKVLHHDDYFTYKDSLTEYVKMLSNNRIIDFAFSSSLTLNNNFEVASQHSTNKEELRLIHEKPEVLFFSSYVGAPSAVIFRNGKSFFFDNKLKWLVDIDFYILVLKKNSEFEYCDRPLISTVAAPMRVTNECLGDKRIQISEMLHVLRKISYRNCKDFRYLKFILGSFISNKVYSFKEISEYNLTGEKLPFVVYCALFFSKTHKVLKTIRRIYK
jgi:glycosyltransferase involved in cell wall biosynthesis